MTKFLRHIITVLFVLAIQIMVLKNLNLNFASYDYTHLFLYPVILILFPIRTPSALLLGIAFVIGLTLDMFYDSPGLHASACVFIAYLRNHLLKIMEPTDGYTVDQSLSINKMGFVWMVSYVSILVFIHILWYFSFEAFSFIYIKEILLRTLFSFIASMLFIMLYIIINNSKS